jgi:hypothetical protein
LDKYISQLEFPINYVEVQQKLLDSLLSGNYLVAINLVYNLVTNDVTKTYLLTDVILPTLNIIDDLHSRGRMGESERLTTNAFVNDLVVLIRLIPPDSTKRLKAYSLCVAGSEDSVSVAKVSSVLMHLSGWNSLFMGNVESKIDPFFDIDIQRYIVKTFGNRKGLIAIIIFSYSESSLRFLSNAIKNLKSRFTGDVRFLVFTKEELKGLARSLGADNASSELDSLLGWLNGEYKKYYG